jgi:hypothetical protein
LKKYFLLHFIFFRYKILEIILCSGWWTLSTDSAHCSPTRVPDPAPLWRARPGGGPPVAPAAGRLCRHRTRVDPAVRHLKPSGKKEEINSSYSAPCGTLIFGSDFIQRDYRKHTLTSLKGQFHDFFVSVAAIIIVNLLIFFFAREWINEYLYAICEWIFVFVCHMHHETTYHHNMA